MIFNNSHINNIEYRRVSFFADFANFLFYIKIVSLKDNIYVRIYSDTKALHGFIVIYWINMASLK